MRSRAVRSSSRCRWGSSTGACGGPGGLVRCRRLEGVAQVVLGDGARHPGARSRRRCAPRRLVDAQEDLHVGGLHDVVGIDGRAPDRRDLQPIPHPRAQELEQLGQGPGVAADRLADELVIRGEGGVGHRGRAARRSGGRGAGRVRPEPAGRAATVGSRIRRPRDGPKSGRRTAGSGSSRAEADIERASSGRAGPGLQPGRRPAAPLTPPFPDAGRSVRRAPQVPSGRGSAPWRPMSRRSQKKSASRAIASR